MKSITFRELRKILARHDPRFEFFRRRGKGSHRAIEHPDIDGERVIFIVPVHGEGAAIKASYLAKIKRNFDLPQDIFD